MGTLYFVLGVGVISIIFLFVIVDKNYKIIKHQQEQIDNLSKKLDSFKTSVGNDLSTQHSDLIKMGKGIYKDMDKELNQLQNKIYSDFDVKRTQRNTY